MNMSFFVVLGSTRYSTEIKMPSSSLRQSNKKHYIYNYKCSKPEIISLSCKDKTMKRIIVFKSLIKQISAAEIISCHIFYGQEKNGNKKVKLEKNEMNENFLFM